MKTTARIDDIIEELAARRVVRIEGFGTFALVDVAAFRRRDWRTGETREYQPSLRLRFKPTRALRKRLASEHQPNDRL